MADAKVAEALARYGEMQGLCRMQAAKAVGWPVVLTLEGMGLRLVPDWVPDMLEKIMKQATQPESADNG